MFKNDFWMWEQGVPPKVCKAILDDIDWSESKKSTILDEKLNVDVENEEKRITDVVWHNEMGMGSILSRMFLNVANNSAGWDFVLHTIEFAQIARYAEKGHYDWHEDHFIGQDSMFCRKLTSVILLNDPSEFEGGKLEIKASDGKTIHQIDLKCGSVVVFPAFLSHRVTPVTKGTRYTAVGWASGPLLR